jgi:hypothetical protein
LQEEGGREGLKEEEGGREGLKEVVGLLGRAEQAFGQCGDLKGMREVYYLEARVHDALAQLQQEEQEEGGEGGREEGVDYVALREEAAGRFFEVVRLLRVNSTVEGGRKGGGEGGEEGFMGSK